MSKPRGMTRLPKGVEVYQPRLFRDDERPTKLISFKSSQKGFIGAEPTSVGWRPIKLIDGDCDVTENLLGFWKCNSYQLWSTYVATMVVRVRARLRRLNKNRSARKKHQCKMDNVKLVHFASVILIKGPVVSRRLWACLTNQPQSFGRLLSYHVSHLCEPYRFLHGQACLHANWLNHRGHPRDQRSCIGHKTRTWNRVPSNPLRYWFYCLRSGVTLWEKENFLSPRRISPVLLANGTFGTSGTKCSGLEKRFERSLDRVTQ